MTRARVTVQTGLTVTTVTAGMAGSAAVRGLRGEGPSQLWEEPFERHPFEATRGFSGLQEIFKWRRQVAGVKGKSGGARPGAGRPRTPPEFLDVRADDGSAHFDNPMAFLLAVMNDGRARPKTRIEAAEALLPYKHQRQGEVRST